MAPCRRRPSAAWLCAALAGAATVALAASQAQPPAAAPAAPLKVAVVDMERVLRASRQWQDAVEERSRLMDAMNRTLGKLTAQVQVLRNEFENLAPGTEERRARGAELEQALQERQQARLDFESRIAGQHSSSARRLFGELEKVVAAYAQQNGVALVLKKHAVELTGPESVEQGLMIATTEVLYADASLDISDAVIERLNAAYEGPIEVK